MKWTHGFALLAALAVLLQIACNDPIVIGSELLDSDRVEVDFTDTFQLRSVTERSEPLRTYSPFSSLQLRRFLFGDYEDPMFGRSSSVINMQILPSGTPAFAGMMGIDSVALILPYISQNFYGKTEGELFGMAVRELSELLSEDEEYFSDRIAATAPEILAEHSFTATADSLSYIDYAGTDPDTIEFAYLRVPMSTSLGQSLVDFYFANDTSFTDIPTFLETFPGFQLAPTTLNEGLLSFNLYNARSGLHIYYRDSSDNPRRYLLRSRLPAEAESVEYATFEHDVTGSKAAAFLDTGTGNDSLLFVQGMAGLRSRIMLPDLSGLSQTSVNQAELEIFVASLEGDDEAFDLPRQLLLMTVDENGEEVLIADARGGGNIPLSSFFGGALSDGEDGEPMSYRFLVSDYLQELIDGNASPVLYIIAIEPGGAANKIRRGETAERAVFYGGSHPLYPPRLKVTFTVL